MRYFGKLSSDYKRKNDVYNKNCLDAGIDAINKNKDSNEIIEAIFNKGIELSTKRYAKIKKMAEYLVSMFPSKGTILTQCFGESIVGFMIREFQKQNKDIKIISKNAKHFPEKISFIF